MLKNSLNYIVFDFETTWLDVKKDEAIQIWIVKFDSKYNIVKQFSSYIKPTNLQNLSEIVEFTTWIQLSQLENAPSFDDIKKEVISFFDENSVLIGHNIAFDIWFLEKYVWKISYKFVFDTYIYARKFLHFEPAYALEILADKYGFKWQSHDALADSIMSMKLFKLIIKKIEKLIQKYPFLADIILKSDNLLKELLVLQPVNRKVFSIPKKWVNIPKTKKVKSDTKLISDFENKTVFDVNGTSIQQAINFCLNGQNKLIFAFSSNARMNLAKSFLKSKYLSFSTLNNGFTISEENEKKLLSKDNFEDFEVDFIIKAFSHYNEDISIFDIANFDDYKVYKFISDKKRNISSNFILTTHYELFSYVKEHGTEKIKDHKIMFFDWQNWMNSLSSVVNKWFDFYELIKKLELIKYESWFSNLTDLTNLTNLTDWKSSTKLWNDSLSSQFSDLSSLYENLINEVSTFFGTLATKLQPLFKNTDNKIEIVNMFEDTRNNLNQFKENFLELDEKINKYTNKETISYWNLFKECVENYCIVEQKLFQNGNLKYIFQPLMENVDINTFNDFMQDFTYYNFTTLENKNYVKLKDLVKDDKLNKDKFIDWNDNIDFKLLVEKVKNKLEEWKSLFLVSNNKNFSNSLFKLIFNLQKEHNLKANLYAENITWWQWKLLYYLSKDHWPKITIWWPEFLIQNKARFINYDEIHLLAIGWKNRKNTLSDLYFYVS